MTRRVSDLLNAGSALEADLAVEEELLLTLQGAVEMKDIPALAFALEQVRNQNSLEIDG